MGIVERTLAPVGRDGRVGKFANRDFDMAVSSARAQNGVLNDPKFKPEKFSIDHSLYTSTDYSSIIFSFIVSNDSEIPSLLASLLEKYSLDKAHVRIYSKTLINGGSNSYVTLQARFSSPGKFLELLEASQVDFALLGKPRLFLPPHVRGGNLLWLEKSKFSPLSEIVSIQNQMTKESI